MKKITFKILVVALLMFAYNGMAQTLNQAASWPNAGWTLTGTYTPAGLLSDPSIAATFSFDDDAAGNGSADDLQATSPVIDLTAASGAGETWITISGDVVYRALTDVLQIEIYDADAMTWSAAETFAGNSTNTDFQTCAGTAMYTTAVINIAGYTGTQLSGFQYRFTYDDQGGWKWGWCLTSPTITSATPPMCPDPSTLTASNIDGFSADLGWTETGSAALWNIELVDITAAGVATGTATSTGVANPFNQTGLTPSNSYEFYVQSDCGGSTSTWVGPFAFSTTVACPDPSALTATNVLTTSADLGWTAGGSEALWDVELVDITAAGVATGTATSTGVANPYNQGGLADSNAYEFYVRADCGVNGASTWVGPFAFTTACTTFTAPYTEDFENAGAVPTCWTLGGDEDWLFNTTGPNQVGNGGTLSGSTTSGGYYAVVDDSTPDATNALLTSPFIDVSGLTTPALTFYEISDNSGNASATLTVSVWDGAAWNVVGTYNTNTVAGWEQKTINLSGLTFTGDAQVQFSIADSGSFYDDIAIDDVSLGELPSCPAPSALGATNITGASADLGWTETGSAALWDIELVDITAGGVATGTATATGVSNPYNQGGLTANNTYEFYVRADCAGDTSMWVGPFAFTTECAVIIPDYTADMSVNVPDACWDEAGSGDSTSGPMDLGASDWRDGTSYALGSSNAINLYSNVDSEWLLSPSFDLSTGGPYQLEVNVAVTNWNQGTVDDTMGSDDEVQLLMSTDGGTTWANVATWNAANEPPVGGIEYVEDLTAITGNVSFAIWATDGTVDDGEDYDFHVGKFRVRSIPSCADPATVMNTVLTDSASDFTWAIGGTETVWEYANLPSPSTEPVSGTSTMTTAASFTGLTPATDYDFYVRSDCGGSFSAWVLVSYSTPATPPANDDCANAIELTVNADETCTTTTPGTIVAATASGEDEASCSGTEDDDVWYSFVATAVSHNIDLLNVANGTTDLYHSVWSGSCGALTNLSCSDPNSSTVNGLTIGNTYLLRVYSWTATPGQTSTFDVCIGTPPPPPPAPANDECDNVVGLTVNLDYNNGIVTAGTTVGATASAQADDVSGTPNTDVWFSFVAIYDAHRVELLNVANRLRVQIWVWVYMMPQEDVLD